MTRDTTTITLGIDFDNTTICYDGIFHQVAVEKGLIPDTLATNKQAVRDHLRKAGQEDDWTELQGFVYGTQLERCKPYEGVLELIASSRDSNLRPFIVSHKTRHPYKGEQHDLHHAARSWLEAQGVFETLAEGDAFFELTMQDKLQRIGLLGCDYFVDDLPEFLLEPNFPQHVQRILFDPYDANADAKDYIRVNSWDEIRTILSGTKGEHD